MVNDNSEFGCRIASEISSFAVGAMVSIWRLSAM